VNALVEGAVLLQRIIGNQATLRLLSQRGFSSAGNELGGDRDREAAPIFLPDVATQLQAQSSLGASPRWAPKLAVGRANGPLKHKADPVGKQMMRRLGPAASTAALPVQVSRKCAACEDEESVARFAHDDRDLGQIPAIVRDVNRSSGKPMDASLRVRFETALGWNFANVRIHADDRAAEAARAVNALAYTSGNDVVFADGQFAPGSVSGHRLLAHELVHVVQQAKGPIRPGISHIDDPLERETDRLANSVMGTGLFERDSVKPSAPGSEPATLTGDPESAAQIAGGGVNLAVQRWPGDGMVPPGDCSWSKYVPLRAAVEAAKAVVKGLGACAVTDNCPLLLAKIAAISTEIAARVALDATCFRGGDTGHRQQVQDKVGMLNRCHRFFEDQNCPAKLAAAAAAAAAGEAFVAGATLTELLEGLLVVLVL
jgi:hypothetical protein